MVAFSGVLQYIKCIIVEFTPPPFSFIPHPIPGTVSTGLIFSIFTHVHMVFALWSPSHTLATPLPTGTNPPERTCSTLLFSNCVKDKKK
jgi:hypothetical protein